MKRIELRRHSIKQGPGNTDLSPEGIQLAQKIGKSELHGKQFTLLFESPMKRSQDTLREFSKAAGDFPNVAAQLFPPHMEVSETEEGMHLWSGVCHRAEQAHADMMLAALEEEPRLARELATKAAGSFRTWLDALPEGARVLVVGHSPFLELIVFGLFNTTLPQLQPCEGFRILEDHQELKLERVDSSSRH